MKVAKIEEHVIKTPLMKTARLATSTSTTNTNTNTNINNNNNNNSSTFKSA